VIFWRNLCNEKRHVFNFFFEVAICEDEDEIRIDDLRFDEIWCALDETFVAGMGVDYLNGALDLGLFDPTRLRKPDTLEFRYGGDYLELEAGHVHLGLASVWQDL